MTDYILKIRSVDSGTWQDTLRSADLGHLRERGEDWLRGGMISDYIILYPHGDGEVAE